ncbi:putative SNF2 DNA repair protein [Trypanosoma rangeli]|uniref:Mannose-P-dolichol utilization defect 1 protein homolog n=1 Tax=Trypanosoma rangeli TaxID=5698 RepID=A0A422MWP8_TRYRA|nr:putative SNF2 DNA repair protein [Trypanosoma rangeli]RNE97609.1 putative SNF2 DNA repair protein [Trypanosoma rangeli]|eukprot:RNE97609.1 putative SNF2 DNA repair protein [Trypanosoma rangeli]
MPVNTSSHSLNDGNLDVEVFLRYFVATILPYGVVFGSVLLKVPQIVKILQHRSADGISFASLCFDLTAFVVTTSWGIAQALNFKDYGENMLIMGEVAFLLLLVGYLQRSMTRALLVFTLEATSLVVMSCGYLPRTFHEWLLSIQILFGISSRVPQILMNYRNQSTGHLSFLTFWLAMAGGVSRLLTTFQNVSVEQGKYIMLMQFGVSVALNAAILLQIVAYREQTRKQLDQQKQGKMAEKDKKQR